MRRPPIGHKVLVIDDDLNVLHILKDYFLDLMDCEVFQAKNVEEGINWCMDHKFSIITSDFHMPDFDGETFIKSIRYSHSINRYTPIILISGVQARLEGDDSIWENVYFIDKPFEKKNLEFILKVTNQESAKKRPWPFKA